MNKANIRIEINWNIGILPFNRQHIDMDIDRVIDVSQETDHLETQKGTKTILQMHLPLVLILQIESHHYGFKSSD